METFFGPDGVLAKDGGPYAFRKEQLDYARACERLIEHDQVGIIEGGTGVGKTLGYLVPHILDAKKRGTRVLVAPRTKNLQDQVYLKDLPRLSQSLGFRYSLLKGRENYICRERLAEALDRSDLFEGSAYHDALVALSEFDENHETGDLEAAWALVRPYGQDGWKAVSDVRATDDTCTSDHRGQCRHYKALAEAERSDVIVANHHLALLWPENFPEVARVVIDEAHALEEAATDIYGPSFCTGFLQSRLRRVYHRRRRPTGILSRFSRNEWMEFEIQPIADAIEDLRILLADFDAFTIRPSAEGDSKSRVRDEDLASEAWSRTCEAAAGISSGLARLSARMLKTWKDVGAVDRLKITAERLQRAALALDELARYADEIFRAVPVDGTVLWSEAPPTRAVMYRRSPVDIGAHLTAHLYNKFQSVLLTSATMQVCGDFQFMEERLGLVAAAPPEPPPARPIAGIDAEELSDPFADEFEAEETAPEPEPPLRLDPARRFFPVSVGHPFDYQSRVLLCLMRDPAPSRHELLSDRIARIAAITRGRMLALFTNKSRMLSVHEALCAHETLGAGGVKVLAQHRDGSRHELAKRMREESNLVLLGTRSFWEGIDIPGANLSVVVMEKIPFTSPGEPVYDARCEALGDLWFRRYALPLALLALRQGFGRLIRTEHDHGIVVILDPGRKSYGPQIRRTLPDCATVEGDEEAVVGAIRTWWEKNRPAEETMGAGASPTPGESPRDEERPCDEEPPGGEEPSAARDEGNQVDRRDGKR